MRILSIVRTLNLDSGGVPQVIFVYDDYFKKNNIIHQVLTTDSSFFDNGVCDVINLKTRHNSWGFSLKLLPWLIKNIGKYDFIIIHGIWLYNSFCVRLANSILKNTSTRNNKYCTFIMPHGMLDSYFQKNSKRGYKIFRNFLYWHLIESYNIKNADAILFANNEELETAKMTFSNYRPKKTFNINMGISLPPRWTPKLDNNFAEKFGLTGRRYILYMGRIDSKKGIDTLLHIYKNHYQKSGSCKVPALVIAGPFTLMNKYEREIFKLVYSDSFLRDNVVFTGRLDNNLKWGALYGCCLFTLLSNQENYAVAVVEALACNKIVLISDNINISKTIKKFNAGIVVSLNPCALLMGLEQWANLDDLDASTIANNANNLFMNEFNIETNGQIFLNILNSVKNDK